MTRLTQTPPMSNMSTFGCFGGGEDAADDGFDAILAVDAARLPAWLVIGAGWVLVTDTVATDTDTGRKEADERDK